MKFWVGYSIKNDGTITDKPVYLDAGMLCRHLGVFGTTGSGKTVFCKAVLEEAARAQVPVIALDPQGDLASLALLGNPEKLLEKGISSDLIQEFKDKVSVRVFTPASTKGAPISVNPLVMPDRRAEEEDVIRIIDNSSRTLISVLIKTAGLPSTYESKAFAVVYEVLKHYWDKNQNIDSLTELADLVIADPNILDLQLDKYMSDRERERLSHALRSLTIGTSELLFSTGEPIDFSKILEPVEEKTPLNIFFLKTLRSEEEKMFFISILLSQLYSWMLQQGSTQKPRMVFFTDEISPFVPSGSVKPGPKDTFLMIFRQARKYGIICMAATQSPKDIDYKAFDQFNTLTLGRIISPQSQKAISHLLDASIGEQDKDYLLDEISHLNVANFLIANPTFPDSVIRVKSRWLFTEHLTLTEDDIRKLTSEEKIIGFDYPSKEIESKIIEEPELVAPEPSLTPKEEQEKSIPTTLSEIDLISHDDVLNTLLARLENIAQTPFGLPFLKELVKEKQLDFEKAQVYYFNEVKLSIKLGLASVQRGKKKSQLVYDFNRVFQSISKKLYIDPTKVNQRHIQNRFEEILQRAKINPILERIALGKPFLEY